MKMCRDWFTATSDCKGSGLLYFSHQDSQTLRAHASHRSRRLGNGMKIRSSRRIFVNAKPVAIQRVAQGLRCHDQGRSPHGEMRRSLRRCLMSSFDRFALCASD